MDNTFIIISCPNCGAKFKIRNAKLGAEFPCNRCQKPVTITENAIVSTPNVPASTIVNRNLFFPQQDNASSTTNNQEEKSQHPQNDTNIFPHNATHVPHNTNRNMLDTEISLSPSNTAAKTFFLQHGNIQETPIAQSNDKPEIVKIDLAYDSRLYDGNLAGHSLTKRVSLQNTPNTNHALSSIASDDKKIFATDLENRQRLLYLISLYTKLAESGKKGIWIRKLPLQVFMFEGIIEEVFDWDYAPASVFHAEGRSLINVSREGEEDLLSLLSGEYVYNLKLTTNQHRSLTAYQVTSKGIKFLEQVSDEEKALVHNLVHCPKCQSLLFVRKKVDTLFRYCSKKDCNYEKPSTITIAEDVSYFCIPYFPRALSHFTYTPPHDLQKRIQMYFERNPKDNIKDQLEELIYLSEVKVLISEWLPFGSNHLAALNYKLGSQERIQSAKFTQEVDCTPSGTLISVPESLTLVKVRDHSLAEYVDFEAISYLPEDPEIVQVEEFAVHINAQGSIRYGLEIKAINDRSCDKISLDHLPRLLVDVLQDSTKIMDTLLTNYQKNLLELVFQNKAKYRDKYFFVIAAEIHCFEQEHSESNHTELMRILSQTKYQDELSQVTEEVKETALFQDGTVLILGGHGAILVTQSPGKYDPLVADFLFGKNIEIFLNNFFVRLFLMNDELKDVQKLIKNCESDPTAVSTVQKMLSRLSSEAILMSEIRGYLEEALSQFNETIIDKYNSYPADMQEILQTFQISEMSLALKIRIQDIRKIIQGTQECLHGLSQIIEVISERQMRRIQEALSNNTRSLEDITKTNERSGMSLRILEIIMAGSLAFNIMDQFTGDWSMSDDASMHHFLQPLFDAPGAWLLVSLSLWGILASLVFLLMRWMESINAKAIVARLKLDIPCHLDNLRKYLANKNLITHDADVFTISNLIKVGWEENDRLHWHGCRPKIELVYDEKNSFLLSALIEVSSPTRSISSHELQNTLLEDLKKANIIRKNFML